MNNLKIVVAFHSTVVHSKAFENKNIFVPIYGGKDITPYMPLQSKLMQGDNEGDNISWMNPFVGELSCLYWAAKHLDKLGNPDYIGLNHYRRLFPIDAILPYLNERIDEFILTTSRNTHIPVLRIAELEYGIGDELNELFHQILKSEHELEVYDRFIEQEEYAEKNIFIMPTSKLDDYINFIMKAIMLLFSKFPFKYLDGMPYRRRTARMLEFVTAYYLYKLSLDGCQRLISNYEYPWKGFC